MARMRTLKPSFFTDADLALLPPLHRLAFEGLWCWADKAGRLEDKPRELKVKILPYDVCDFEVILADLAKPRNGGPGHIIRYQVGSRRCIFITQFPKHQKPHPKEPPSELPEPEPWKNTAGQCLDKTEPRKDLVEPGGSLFLGSGSLLLGGGEPAPPESPPPPDPISAMGGTQIPLAVVAQIADRRSLQSPLRNIPVATTPPDTPSDEWLGMDFWRWVQGRRKASGLPQEPPPDPRKLNPWWSAARMTVSASALQEAYFRFGDDTKYWLNARPPFPFAGFMSQWQDYLPIEPVEEGAAYGHGA